jgi:Icc-related predicted phosphoesterase
MRLLFVSDLHYSLKQFDWLLSQAQDFDAVVIGGDLLDLSSALDADVQIAIVEKYLALIRQKTTLVVCSGNHDGDCRNEADESIARWVREARHEGLHVDGDSFFIGGTLISVCPWWDGGLTRALIEQQLERDAAKEKACWIWIHHAPPLGARTSWTGRKFIGDEHLRGWITRFRPEMVFSGHIHNSPFYPEGSWIDRLDGAWVFNPGRQIGPQPATIILDLDAMTAEWSSLEGRSVRSLRISEG